MVKPPALKPGDMIGVIAPASNVRMDWLTAGVRELERLGFRVIHRPDIGAKERYTAGTLRRRLDELHTLWTNPEVKAIVAARGGYGTMHLLPHIEAARLRAQPKIFVGYSDLTALHLFLHRACDLVTFHGPMVAKDFSAGPTHYDWDSFQRLVMNAQPAGKLTSPHVETLIGGTATGRLVGAAFPSWRRWSVRRGNSPPRGLSCFWKTRPPSPTRLTACSSSCGWPDNLTGWPGLSLVK
ncbi:LD-carboxypeptidase [Chloracidobacterium sp. 2]|nr:LD-carboxypeptidase [Chloracidobacterium sp. 2]